MTCCTWRQSHLVMFITTIPTQTMRFDLVVVSASGAEVLSYHVPAGQSSTQIQANAYAGMYCISRLQKNKAAETKKIIVK